MSSIDVNAISVVVRVRPFHPEKEEPFVARAFNQQFFLGDGAFASSPRKPISSGSIRQVIDVCDSRMLNFDKPEIGAEIRRGQPGAKRFRNRQYVFDSVLKMEASQEEVFEKTALPLLDGVLTGFNATVFAYGATGCGKTHTISGNPTEPGIIIRTTAELFRRIEESADEYDTVIELSMVEIYNETIRDLLAAEDALVPKGGLKLQENDKERVRVDGVALLRPKTVDEVMEYVRIGNDRRSTSSTAMNAVSSRSHAVLQINISRSSKTHDVDMAEAAVRQATTSATLSIIDLAGSERASATQNMGARMREGANINKSLLALSSCIAALCERPVNGRRAHVPYRDSKLTRMLKFSLGGNCRTVMVVCVSPSSRDIEDTNNTLVWANKAKNVSTKVTRNTQGVDVRVQQYLEAIQKLTMECAGYKREIEEMKHADKVWTDNKRLKEREDCQKAVIDVADLIGGAMPALTDGAGRRAGWDGAEMIVAALRQRLDLAQAEGSELEVTLISSLIRQQDMRFKTDVPTINAIQKESTQKSTIDNVLNNLSQRKFGPTTHAADLDNVRTHVQLKRAEVDRTLLDAREKVYRQAAQNQATALASAASALHRLASGLPEHTRALLTIAARHAGSAEIEGIVHELEVLGETSKSTLSSLFASAAGGMLPALPTAGELGTGTTGRFAGAGVSDTLSPASNSLSTGRHPVKKRNSILPRAARPETSSSKRSAVLASPAGKRLLGSATKAKPPASPARKAQPGTPGKRRLGKTIVPAKLKGTGGIRWKDTEGEGELEHHKIMTSDSSSGNLGSVDDEDASGEWEAEVEDELAPLPSKAADVRQVMGSKPLPTITLPKRQLPPPARPATLALPKSLIPVPKPSPPSNSSSSASLRKPPSPSPLKPVASVPPPTSTSATSSDGLGAADQAWKAARGSRLMFANLRTLDEEGSSMSGSSPDSGPSKLQSQPLGNLGLGAASRIRMPLNDRPDVPGGNGNGSMSSINLNSNSSLSTSFPPGTSGIYRPTMASQGKAGGMLPPAMPSVSGTTGPRPSVAGGSGMRPGARGRVSSIGPQRNERNRARTSFAPGMGLGMGAGNSSSVGLGAGFPGIGGMGDTSYAVGETSTAFNPLGGGAQRLYAPTASSLSRKNSTLNLGSNAGGVGEMGSWGSKGPRASMSMSQLRPRASVQGGLFKAGLSAGGAPR